MQQNDKYEEVKEALNVGDYNMIVTPKEIDFVINDEYPASIKNGQIDGMSDDLDDDPDTIYYAVWFSDDEDDYIDPQYIKEMEDLVKKLKEKNNKEQ